MSQEKGIKQEAGGKQKQPGAGDSAKEEGKMEAEQRQEWEINDGYHEEEKKRQIRREMEEKEADFAQKRKAYYAGRCTEKELTEDATQPFYESMRLSRKRLEKHNLTVDVQTEEDRSQGRFSLLLNPEMYRGPYKDGADYVGMHCHPLKVKRTYYRNGKKLCRQKDYEISRTQFLKSDVEGDMAACPNCGHMGKISSYIDGCDYCDAKFVVSDFETKVSGYTVEENVPKKAQKTFTRMLGIMFFTSIGLVVLGVLAAVLVLMLLMQGNNGTQAVWSGIVMIIALGMYDQLGAIFAILFWVYLILFIVLIAKTRVQISGENLVKRLIPEFSMQDFLQNLEYQLKNIHLTDNAEAVQPFAHCSLKEVVEEYRNVVDCALCSLTFTSAEQTIEGIRAEATVKMRLSYDTGRKIKTRYEKLKLTMTCSGEALHREKTAIREYKCPGCGSSVDILSGGVCPYCGTHMDYGTFGWVMEKYEKGKAENLYKRIVFLFIAIYIGAIAIGAIAAGNTENGREMLSAADMMIHRDAILNEIYGSVERPEEWRADIDCVDTSKDNISRCYTYSCEDGEQTAADYADFLRSENLTETETGTASYCFYRETAYDGEEGYIKVTIEPAADSMKVTFSMVEKIGE